MKVVTQTEFDAVAKTDQYYRNRWPYMSKASEIISGLKLSGRVLEIGAYKLPLVHGSDLFDISIKGGLPLAFQRDANHLPWPVLDKAYDLFVALQVWEHLKRSKHPALFREVERVSQWALLSFPYKWNCPKDSTHHGIDDDVIAAWTANHPHKRWLMGTGNGNRRMLCLFRFHGD